MTEVDLLVRQGIFYPRWFPDFGLGHGYPIFNFFPPLGYLLTELPALLLRDLALAIQVSIAVSVLVSGWGMYALARAIGSSRPLAVVSAVLYLYIPYHVQDIYTRGGMPELWAIAWLPWLCCAQIRAVRDPSLFRISVAALLVSIEVCTHNAMALFLLPLAMVLSLSFSSFRRNSWLTAMSCSALGLLFSAGYWLPAVAESGLTRVNQLAGDWLDLHTFDLPQLVDLVFFAPQGDQVYKLTILEAAVLLGLGAAVVWHGRRSGRQTPGFVVAGFCLLFCLSLTRLSIPFWSAVPLVHYVQFPWRMLIPIGLLLALMASMAGQVHRLAWLPLGAVAAVMAVSSLGQVQDSRLVPPPSLDAQTLETHEYGSALDGVAIESEYQPKTGAREVVYAAQGRRAPEDTAAFPTIQVRGLTARPTQTQLTIEAQQPSRIRLQAFYFAGWRARLDRSAWPLRAAEPAGYIEADIPAGEHTLDVSYSGTRLQGLSGLLSGVALLAAACWLLRRRPWGIAGLLAVVAASVILVRHAPATEGALHPASWSPAPNQTLIGADGPRVTARGIETDLFWLYASPQDAPFDFVLRDSRGSDVVRMPARAAATMPYEYVAANELLRRRYTIPTPEPGSYALLLQIPTSQIDLGQVSVTAGPPAQHPLDVRFQQQATLRAYSVDRVRSLPGLTRENLPGKADVLVRPGDWVLASLSWLAGQTLDQNFTVFVHLLDAEGRPWAAHDNQPNGGLQATGSWSNGQTNSDRFLLKIPPKTPPGMYRLEVGMYRIDELGYHFLPLVSGGNSVLFGSVKVQASSSLPPSSPVARWNAPISLRGWHADQRASDLDLTFDWFASGSLDIDYTLFVHLLDSAGTIAAQVDSPPERGLYRTTLWDAGDTIPDLHRLQSPPPGRYRLEIGWYDPATGSRLPLSSGSDTLSLGDVEIR